LAEPEPQITAGYTPQMTLGRRQACLGAATLFASFTGTAGAAECSTFETRILDVSGERLAKRCQLLVPRDRAKSRRLLVLLHGLGETTSENLGIRAWADRYGLCSAYERLKRPPVRRVLSDAEYLTDARLAELDGELARAPFRGLAIACPFTPNVYRVGPTGAVLDRYATWLVDRLVPALCRELGIENAKVGIDGVSLGGFAALEVFLRRPEAFASVGSLQGPFKAGSVDGYAARIERAFTEKGRRPLRIATSSVDPGRAANERLVGLLAKRGIVATLSAPPGPHDQRFLREAGSLELLLWHDRALPEAAA
jgi:pimeloyl-ACP methyl ester carboxylesterase